MVKSRDILRPPKLRLFCALLLVGLIREVDKAYDYLAVGVHSVNVPDNVFLSTGVTIVDILWRPIQKDRKVFLLLL